MPVQKNQSAVTDMGQKGFPVASRFVTDSPLTWFLVALNVAVFCWIRIQTAKKASPHVLSHYGANWGFQTLSGEWWRLFTSLFVHIETTHLIMNLVGLTLFGRHIERVLGTRPFVLLYFAPGLAGGILLIAMTPEA